MSQDINQLLASKASEVIDLCFKRSNDNIDRFVECFKPKTQALGNIVDRMSVSVHFLQKKMQICQENNSLKECQEKCNPLMMDFMEKFKKDVNSI